MMTSSLPGLIDFAVTSSSSTSSRTDLPQPLISHLTRPPSRTLVRVHACLRALYLLPSTPLNFVHLLLFLGGVVESCVCWVGCALFPGCSSQTKYTIISWMMTPRALCHSFPRHHVRFAVHFQRHHVHFAVQPGMRPVPSVGNVGMLKRYEGEWNNLFLNTGYGYNGYDLAWFSSQCIAEWVADDALTSDRCQEAVYMGKEKTKVLPKFFVVLLIIVIVVVWLIFMLAYPCCLACNCTSCLSCCVCYRLLPCTPSLGANNVESAGNGGTGSINGKVDGRKESVGAVVLDDGPVPLTTRLSTRSAVDQRLSSTRLSTRSAVDQRLSTTRLSTGSGVDQRHAMTTRLSTGSAVSFV